MAPPARAGDAHWTHETTQEGIRIFSRAVAGQSLPEFRGVGTVNGSIFEVLAVFDDASRHPEWMASCVQSSVLRYLDGFDRIVYNRTSAPWPVADRDVVVRSRLQVDAEKGQVINVFEAIASRLRSPVEGVVRIPRLRGFYKLNAIEGDRTRIVYQVYADPGGMIPTAVAKRASVRLPLQTILGLRKQVKRTRGEYDAFVARYDPRRGGTIPAAKP